MIRLLALAAFVLALWGMSALSTPQAHGCAFSQTPNTYEASSDRTAYLRGLELAGFNMIAPNDTFFGTPNVETGARGSRALAADPHVPPTLLKAIGWIESNLAQANGNTPWSAVGPTLVSFDCGHGIMQITSGMTSPNDNGWPSTRQALVATHYLYNIARGAAILVEKWNGAPEVRPVAGTDTSSDPTIVENWYFALWGYNGFTGPGANRSNHPMDPIYADWPRTGFSCGSLTDGYGHSYGNYPYQEIVLGCYSRPPSVNGQSVWTAPAVAISLPDLNDRRWSDPLDLDNWGDCAARSRCSAMDIPSPSPWHRDQTARPGNSIRSLLLGSPTLTVSHATVTGRSTAVTISNQGSGILAWKARPAQSWIRLDKQGGVALSSDVPCSANAPCQRSPTLTITVVESQAPTNGTRGRVDVTSLTTGQVWQVDVIPPGQQPAPVAGDARCDGVVDSLDAAVVLQYGAGLLGSVPCHQNAEVNGDGRIDGVDALLILQHSAGLIDRLPI